MKMKIKIKCYKRGSGRIEYSQKYKIQIAWFQLEKINKMNLKSEIKHKNKMKNILIRLLYNSFAVIVRFHSNQSVEHTPPTSILFGSLHLVHLCRTEINERGKS